MATPHRWRFLIAFLLFFIPLPMVSATSYEAQILEQAEQSISSSFQMVLEAENAGANVSGLTAKLNEAAGLLVEAKILVQNGDSRQAADLAGYLVEVAEDVKDEALSLKASALSHRDFLFKVSLVGTLVGVPAFLAFMFLLWRWFKGHYVRRILGWKPTLSGNSSLSRRGSFECEGRGVGYSYAGGGQHVGAADGVGRDLPRGREVAFRISSY